MAGSAAALSSVFRLHLPPLRRWAHGRLPPWLRRVADTGDLVQNAMLRTMRRLHSVHPRSHDALAAYLRTAVMNQIRDEHRRLQVRGPVIEPAEELVSPGLSPFDEASFEQTRGRYLAALRNLKPRERELVVAYVELGYSHAQLGCMIGRSPNAARSALRRALEKLGEQMHDVETPAR